MYPVKSSWGPRSEEREFNRASQHNEHDKHKHRVGQGKDID